MSKTYDSSLRFQSIGDAARTTGLSQYYLRRGCRDGSLPYVKSGNKFLINVPLLIEQIDKESVQSMRAT